MCLINRKLEFFEFLVVEWKNISSFFLASFFSKWFSAWREPQNCWTTRTKKGVFSAIEDYVCWSNEEIGGIPQVLIYTYADHSVPNTID